MMVAYSFQRQFVAPIMSGEKQQTIRRGRKRHARPGETLQLFTGMRTRHCKLIGTAVCFEVYNVTLDFCDDSIFISDGAARKGFIRDLHAFAIMDGFNSWAGLRQFWATQHPGIDVFQGVIIHWNRSFHARQVAE